MTFDDIKRALGTAFNSGVPSKLVSTALQAFVPVAKTAQTVQSIVAPGLNPITRDYQVGEKLGGNRTYSSGGDVGTSVNTGPGTIGGSVTSAQLSPEEMAALGGGNTGGGGTDTGAGGSGPNFDQLIELARSAYDEGLRRVRSAFDRTKGIYDEGVSGLKKKIGEFTDTYNTGSSDILNKYEQERGNLQASAKNAETKSNNLLRALGLGGSAIVRSEGRLRQEGAKQAGNLSEQRTFNDRENLKQFNANQDWANSQQSALDRILADANEQRIAAENSAGLVYAGDVGAINERMDNYFNNLAALEAAGGSTNAGTSAKTVNPYAVNIDSLVNSLNPSTPDAGTPGVSTTAQAANVVDDNTLLSLLQRQKRAGIAGSGLYA